MKIIMASIRVAVVFLRRRLRMTHFLSLGDIGGPPKNSELITCDGSQVSGTESLDGY
jgi:hypothetical protein